MHIIHLSHHPSGTYVNHRNHQIRGAIHAERNVAVRTRPLVVSLGSIALLALTACSGGNATTAQSPAPAATVTVTAEAEPAPTVTVTQTVTVPPEHDEAEDVVAEEAVAAEADTADRSETSGGSSGETSGQTNARGSAESYLDYSAFSRQGLIEQLEYEGFSTDDAEHAVDALDVDWSEQAAKSAESYLEYSSFSLEGLIDQLVYEGFTDEQAEYGAKQAY